LYTHEIKFDAVRFLTQSILFHNSVNTDVKSRPSDHDQMAENAWLGERGKLPTAVDLGPSKQKVNGLWNHLPNKVVYEYEGKCEITHEW